MRTLHRERTNEELGRSVNRFDAVRSQALSTPPILDRTVRRWAKVQFVFGFLQMFGAAFSLTLLVVSGITPLALGAVLITGMITTISIFLFRVWKRGGNPSRTGGANRL
jgi:hypothetical protein